MLLTKTLRSSTLKLAFIYVLVFSSAVFALLGYVYLSTTAYIYDKSDQLLNIECQLMDNSYQKAGRIGIVDQINRRIGDNFFSDWVYLLTSPGHDYLAGNLKTWPSSFESKPQWSTLVTLPPGFDKTEAALRATSRVLPDGDHLLIAHKFEDIRGLLEKIATALAWGAGLFLILAAAAGISTSRRSVARIESINATSLKIMRAGLGERIPLRGTGDEWDGLARNLNSMLDRIEELMESVRQVSDNVAHDLRTPLTRMRGRLEKGCNQSLGVSQYQALLSDTIIELDEVLSRFSAMLRISQIEMLNQRAGFHDIDLTQIAREVVELFDPSAEEKGITLQFLGSQKAPVFGDRDLLFDALSNLVDNAIKHGEGHDTVTVEVNGDGRGPVVIVADHGPGIPADERKNVLKRFYRLEHSRNSPGSGLGLSLVAAVANLHGVQIEMTDNAPGLRIELHFPPPAAAAGQQFFRAVAPLP